MCKYIFSLILSFFFLILTSSTVFAEANKFYTNSLTSYSVDKSGNTKVIQKVQIRNLTQFYISSSYTVQVAFSDISNVKAFDDIGQLKTTIKTGNSNTLIAVTFRNRVVGVDEEYEFTFSFETSEIAQKRGSIWIINIPGLLNYEDFDKYNVNLSVPPEFGQASILKPSNPKIKNGSSFGFSKEDMESGGIFIAFGDSQYYEFDLSYFIANSNLFPIKTEIALPPDTNYQQIILSSITPKPINVSQDIDGNWLALFNLNPQQKIDVKVKGYAKVNAAPKKVELSKDNRSLYLSSDEYWQVDDEEIKKIAQTLKTPDKIYDFVVKKLTYSYDKVKGDNERQGARKVLQNLNFAVCLEFSDLFIALARSAGIPARGVEGFAYTQDKKSRPLSLSGDVLHAWAQFYDDEQKTWVMVDPTWGNTTKGMDYFKTFDFDHLTFVIKGRDSTYPIPPGGYKIDPNSQDVNVRFSSNSYFLPKTSYQLFHNFPSFNLAGFPIRGDITVVNKGNTSLSKYKLSIENDLTNFYKSFVFDYIPPMGSKILKVDLGQAPFLTNAYSTIKMRSETYVSSAKIKVGILPANPINIIAGGVILSSVASLAIIAIKIRSVSLQKQKR